MKLIKPKGLLIGEKRFQLVGPNGEASKEFNARKTNKKKKLYSVSSTVAEKGLKYGLYKFDGSKEKVMGLEGRYNHGRFVKLLNEIQKKNKSVLIIGPGEGYEIKYIKESVKGVKTNTFDIVDGINPKYKKYVEQNKIIVDKEGIENYSNKDMLGKYDGITAIYSAGYHTYFPERNIIKIILMLKPKGVALITYQMQNINKLKQMLIKLKLSEFYSIESSTYNQLVIKRIK